MTQCLLVTCARCDGIIAMAIDGDIPEVHLRRCKSKEDWDRLQELQFALQDMAAINKLPVCNCSDAIKALEAK